MNKVKFHLEYLLKPASRQILWNSISTTAGMELWLADKVTLADNIFTFRWGKSELKEAMLVSIRSFSHIRMHWCDDENDKTFFEMRMSKNEMTNESVLEITDFAEPEDIEVMKDLWDSQIESLRRQGGM